MNTSNKEHRLFIIIGPTGGKKSAIVKYLSNVLNMPVVNSDVYKAYKNTGKWVNQIDDESLNSTTYHLYDFLDPSYKINAFEYQQLAREKISSLLKLSDVFLVGGSCLYMNAILFNEYKFGNEGKQQRPKNFTFFFKHTKCYRLIWERSEIYSIIDNRVDKMYNNSGIEEPLYFLNKYPDSLVSKAIGYKEWNFFLDKTSTVSEVLDKIKQNTRNYAKRQETWYSNQYTDAIKIPITLNKLNYVQNQLLKIINMG